MAQDCDFAQEKSYIFNHKIHMKCKSEKTINNLGHYKIYTHADILDNNKQAYLS